MSALFTPEFFIAAIFVAVMASLLIGFPVAFTIGGVSLIFAGLAASLGYIDPTYLNFFPNRLFGFMTNEVLLAIPLFIFMGVVLERSRVAEDMLETLGSSFYWLPGGLGISVFVVGALLAASTGIVAATVIAMGLISLPTMLKFGYDKRLASGIVCASGTLGQIIPPSIVLIVVGDQISVAHYAAQRALGNFAPDPLSVGHLFAGALIPGLVLVSLYVLFVFLVGFLRPSAAPSLRGPVAIRGESSVGHGIRLFRAVFAPLFLIVSVLGSILLGIATPTEAAAVGAIGAVFLGALQHVRRVVEVYAGIGCLIALLIATSVFDLRYGRGAAATPLETAMLYVAFVLCAGLVWGLGRSLFALARGAVLSESALKACSVTAMAFAIVIGAQIFILVFRGLGGEQLTHDLLAALPGGAAGAMLFVMVAIFLLGFFLDFLEITFIIIPILAPALLMMGLDPIWVGVMIAMNMQTSFMTPPFGFSLFYLRGVAPPTVETWAIYQGAMPFVGLQILCLCLLAVFPGLATYLPGVLY